MIPRFGDDVCYYDPATQKLHVGPNATVYEIYHEKAHKVQHAAQCWPWCTWANLNGIRFLQYFAWLWVEFDAKRRAQHAMEWHGVWNQAASNEASTMFRTYIKGR